MSAVVHPPVSMAIKSVTPPTSLTPVGDRPLFVETHEDFLCPVCHRMLQRPMQTECGHLLCEECLDNLLLYEDPALCPGNEETCVKLTRDPPTARIDYYANRKIQGFAVRCSNSKCTETMPWSKLNEHLLQCEYSTLTCPYAERGCPEAGSPGDNAIHSKVCQYRPSDCMYCQRIITHRDMTRHHQNECEEFPVYCPHKCQTSSFTRKQMLAHIDRCPAKPEEVNCSMQIFGCEFRGSKEDCNKHMVSAGQQHFQLMAIKVASLDTENAALRNQIHEVRCQGENAEYKLLEHSKTTTAMQRRMATSDNGLKAVWTEVNATSEKVRSLESRLNRYGEDLGEIRASLQILADERKNANIPVVNGHRDSNADLDRQITQLNVQLADLDLRMSNASGNVPLDQRPWRIPNFQQLRIHAETGNERYINSPSFYTTKGMYHVRLRMYPAGDGQGHGTHISLYLQILKGIYDSVIEWPFRYCVDFELLDQVHCRNHLKDTFYPDPASTSFQRPVEEENIASGAPTFVSLVQISKANSPHLVDDAIFIRLTLTRMDPPYN